MLRSAPHTLEPLVSDLADERLRRKDGADGWSIPEIVAHLVDGEQAWFRRVRLMVEEDHPIMDRFPNLDYTKPTLQESMHVFRTLRQADVAYLDGLAPEQWGRGGVHSHWGEIDVLWAARHLAAHDADHLAQIARLRRLDEPGRATS